MLSSGTTAFDKEIAKFIHYRHLAEHASPPQAEPFDVSFVPPNAYWSSADKSTLFHAIARHSRWRPDLICDEIGGGKSIADVCSYIQLLEQGLRGARNTSRSRDTLPIAREVSEDWMRAEESMAESLRSEEMGWYMSASKRKRREEVRAVKKSLKTEGQQDNDTTIGKDQESNEEQQTWEERLKQRKRDFAAVWKREDLLLSLDGKYLKAMEAMIRTLEEDEKARELQLEGSTSSDHNQLPHPVSPANATPVQPPTTEPQRHPNSNLIENSHIDPALLALDQQSLPVVPSTEATAASGKNPGPSGLRSASLSPTRSPNITSNDDNSSSPFKLPPDLSPASRRRIRKRLWMRRKRALESGLPASEVSEDVRKLKPGRKGMHEDKKENSKVTDAEDQDNPLSEGNDDNREDGGLVQDPEDSESAVKRKPPGCAKLESVGVDAAFLRTAGLDLFSLGNFSSFARLMNDVYQSPDEADDAMPELSYSFLLLLRAHLHYFLSRVIGQIITQKGVETQQRMRVRSGNHANRAVKIRRKNVHAALKIMEYPSTSKPFFQRLKKDVRDTADPGDRGKTSRERRGSKRHAGSDDSWSDNSNTGSDSETEATNNESQDTGSSDELTSSRPFEISHNFIPQTEFQLVWGGDQEDATQLLDDLDEDGLVKELKAEEALDIRDQVADRELEDLLWEEIGVRRIPEEPSERKGKAKKSADAKSIASIRFRKPGGAIKSSVYINDSDEDDWEGPDQ